jgi:hypothetical protein
MCTQIKSEGYIQLSTAVGKIGYKWQIMDTLNLQLTELQLLRDCCVFEKKYISVDVLYGIIVK